MAEETKETKKIIPESKKKHKKKHKKKKVLLKVPHLLKNVKLCAIIIVCDEIKGWSLIYEKEIKCVSDSYTLPYDY